jgi:GTPase SAR1 family protein
MALTIICVTGPGSTGKTSIIREFTARHLKYERAKGDILGIFPMPRLGYAVGVTGSGDHLNFILRGRKFLTRYDGLRVMIVASRSGGTTIQEVERFAEKAKAILHLIATKKLAGARERVVAISSNVSKIRRLMPRR